MLSRLACSSTSSADEWPRIAARCARTTPSTIALLSAGDWPDRRSTRDSSSSSSSGMSETSTSAEMSKSPPLVSSQYWRRWKGYVGKEVAAAPLPAKNTGQSTLAPAAWASASE